MSFEVYAAKFLLNDYRGMLRASGHDISTSPIPAPVVGAATRLAYDGLISRSVLRGFIKELLA